jgi:hypothetical protein
MELIAAFIANYIQQHAHPVNAPLHLVGVPILVMGLYRLARRRWRAGLVLIAISYALQFTGHAIHGTEVGEVTLIRWLWHRFGPAV